MSEISRVNQKIFGESAGVGEFGKFGSEAAGSIDYTKDPAEIQALSQFLQGLFSVTANGAEPPRIQDINALYYLFSRQIAYCLQAGIPEWDADTDYFNEKSFVQGSDGSIYIAIRGDEVVKNINKNPLTESTWWRKILDKNGKAVDAGKVGGVAPGAGGLLLLALASLSSYSPRMDGSASAGTRNTPAREDHRHPTDTTRASASRKIIAGTGLWGGGDLTNDRTLAVNYQYILELVYPINSFYIQFPSFDSNNEFTDSHRPSVLFAALDGTWEEKWQTESVFFRTGGTDSNTGRTSGLQLDQMQRIGGFFYGTRSIGDRILSGCFVDGATTSDRLSELGSGVHIHNFRFDSSRSDDARTSSGYEGETRVKNRRMKIWKRVT